MDSKDEPINVAVMAVEITEIAVHSTMRYQKPLLQLTPSREKPPLELQM